MRQAAAGQVRREGTGVSSMAMPHQQSLRLHQAAGGNMIVMMTSCIPTVHLLHFPECTRECTRDTGASPKAHQTSTHCSNIETQCF
jgi:hypothetical protein